jgi:peroxiredoxin
MLPLGTKAPYLALPDAEGKLVRLEDFEGAPALVVVFMCNHCPFVIHIREALASFGREMRELGVAMVGINSNDAEAYPADSPEKMREEAMLHGYVFPYLFDETQEVAKTYQAACTPDFYLFDAERRLVYRGQFDDSRPGSGVASTGADLRAAVHALLGGRQPGAEQKASLGCNIKWRPGNAPEYFG